MRRRGKPSSPSRTHRVGSVGSERTRLPVTGAPLETRRSSASATEAHRPASVDRDTGPVELKQPGDLQLAIDTLATLHRELGQSINPTTTTSTPQGSWRKRRELDSLPLRSRPDGDAIHARPCHSGGRRRWTGDCGRTIVEGMSSPVLCTDLCTRRSGTCRDGEDTEGRARSRTTSPPRSTRRTETARIGGDERRGAHNPEVAGSNPAPATRQNGSGIMDSGAVFCYL